MNDINQTYYVTDLFSFFGLNRESTKKTIYTAMNNYDYDLNNSKRIVIKINETVEKVKF